MKLRISVLALLLNSHHLASVRASDGRGASVAEPPLDGNDLDNNIPGDLPTDEDNFQGFATSNACVPKCPSSEPVINTEACDSTDIGDCDCVYSDRFCTTRCEGDVWRSICLGGGLPAPTDMSDDITTVHTPDITPDGVDNEKSTQASTRDSN